MLCSSSSPRCCSVSLCSIRASEAKNDVSFEFRRAKVELVNHCKPVSCDVGDFGSADEFRYSECKIPSFTPIPVFFAAVVAIFFDAKVPCADEFEPV